MFDIKQLTQLDQEVIDALSNLSGWKDQNGHFIRVSSSLATLAGWKSAKAMEGTTDSQLQCCAADHAEEFRNYDLMLMQEQKSELVLSYTKYADGDYHLLFGKDQVFKDSNREILGTNFQGLDVTNTPFFSQFLSIMFADQKKAKPFQTDAMYSIHQDYHDSIKLTDRETQCLFYTIRGATSKEIGKSLNISSRTVECFIDSVRLKFKCRNKNELLSCTLRQNMANIIPKIFLSGVC